VSAIDLDGIAITVEAYMIDTVDIKRQTDTLMDVVTMEDTPVYTLIYSGKAFVSPVGDPAGTLRATEDVYRVQYEIGLPRTAAEIKPGDQVWVTASNDPSFAISEPLLVHDEVTATFFTHRRVKAFRDRSAV
jgi:hypothetical protein